MKDFIETSVKVIFTAIALSLTGYCLYISGYQKGLCDKRSKAITDQVYLDSAITNCNYFYPTPEPDRQ